MPGPVVRSKAVAQAVAMLSGLPREVVLRLLMSRVFREGSPVPPILGSAGTIPEDERYLRQYLFPERDILPRIGTEQGMAVRQMRLEPDAHFKRVEPYLTRDASGLMPGTEDLASRLIGLGGHSATPQGSTVRVEDVWDMKSPNIHPLISQLLDRYLGSPFKIQEDVPIR